MRKPAFVACLAVLAVIAVPVIGFAQLTGSHGGTPTDVFTQINQDECGSVTPDGVTAIWQELELEVPSHLILTYTTRWGDLDPREEGIASFILDQGARQSSEYSVAGSQIGRTTQTITWTFDNVDPGSHSVDVWSRLDSSPPGSSIDGGQAEAGLSQCVLTVFVAPVDA